MVATVCCEGAWGGTGCWEDGQTYDSCCSPIQTKSLVPGKNKPLSCDRVLELVATVLNREAIARLIAPVQERVVKAAQELPKPNSSRELVTSFQRFLLGPTLMEQEIMLELIAVIAGTLESRQMSYWAHGRTLEGLMRHYGPIPWEEASSLAVFSVDPLSVSDALEESTAHEHPIFGRLRMTPLAASNEQAHGQWIVFFANTARYTKAGLPLPHVQVDWFDPQGESTAWRINFGHQRRLNYRKLLAMMMPAIHRRPFGQLQLPVPSKCTELLAAQQPESSLPAVPRRFLEVCNHPDETEAKALSCATLASAFPMVLASHEHISPWELFKSLGRLAHGPLSARSAERERLKPLVAAISMSGRHDWQFSVEIAANTMRGPHVLLLAEDKQVGAEQSALCWKHIYGKYTLVRGRATTAPEH